MMQGFKCRLCDLASAELPTGMTEGYLLRSQISGSLSLGKPCRAVEGAERFHGHVAQSVPERSTPFKSPMNPPLHVARRTHYPAGFWCPSRPGKLVQSFVREPPMMTCPQSTSQPPS